MSGSTPVHGAASDSVEQQSLSAGLWFECYLGLAAMGRSGAVLPISAGMLSTSDLLDSTTPATQTGSKLMNALMGGVRKAYTSTDVLRRKLYQVRDR
jgi:hypothetical protein